MNDNFDKFEKKAKELFEDIYDKLDSRIHTVSEKLKEDFLPEAEKKLKKNVFKTIFFSFGIGFLIGILVALFGFKSGRKK